jgi:aryl-alcohol dehydrogenase-like predicted oxidoreductase
VPRLGLGCTRLGSASGGGWRASVRLVHAAFDSDVRFFDTADAYGAGSSERVLGRALSGRRASVTIATKGGYRFSERGPVRAWVRSSGASAIRRLRRPRPGSGAATRGSGYAEQDFSTGYLTTALEGSLRRLRTDHVDLYQLHGPRGVAADEIADWAERMVADGKIGGLGVGAEDLDQARTWLSCAAVSSVQVPFGLLDPDAAHDVIPTAHRSGRTVIVRGVLGAGLLGAADAGEAHVDKAPLIGALRSLAADAGSTMLALAIGFVRSRPDVDVMLVGTTSTEHLGAVVTMMAAGDLDAGLLGRIDDVLSAYRQERSAS